MKGIPGADGEPIVPPGPNLFIWIFLAKMSFNEIDLIVVSPVNKCGRLLRNALRLFAA